MMRWLELPRSFKVGVAFALALGFQAPAMADESPMDQLRSALDQVQNSGTDVSALRPELDALDQKFKRMMQIQAEAEKLQNEVNQLSEEFSTGMDAFSNRMQAVINGEPDPGPSTSSGGGDSGGGTNYSGGQHPGAPGMGGGAPPSMPGGAMNPIDAWKQSLAGLKAAGIDTGALESEIEGARPKYDKMMKLSAEVQGAAAKGQAPDPATMQAMQQASMDWSSTAMAIGQKIAQAAAGS